MNILAVDTSATSASVAYMQNEKILGQYYINAKLTHSTTLMPMLKHLLESARLSLAEVDYFAVAAGPGSFTGLRIGIAAVKGLAMAEDKMCVPVSTLEAIAYNYAYSNTLVCAVIDARCSQFFNAIFRCRADGTVERLCDDRAILSDELAQELSEKYADTPVVLAGDGALLAQKLMGSAAKNISVAPPHLMYQQSSAVAMASHRLIEQGRAVTAAQLLPSYLRLPQAQQQLQKKLSRSC